MKTLLIPLMASLGIIAHGQEALDVQGEVHPSIEFFPLRATVRVVDEGGQPVEGASVDLGIPNARYKDELNNFLGRTKADGTFSAEAQANGSTLPIVVTKEGHYISRLFYEGMENNPAKVRKLGRFEPWDPTVDIVLKKIGKPIPMLVRLENDGEKLLPVTGMEIPFDLFVWDWLPPHGKGKVADLIVRVDDQKEGDEIQSVSMKLHFVNKHDGLIPIMEPRGMESELKFPRTAPLGDYDMKEVLVSYSKVHPRNYEDFKKLPKGYFLRIRTQVNAEGGWFQLTMARSIEQICVMGALPPLTSTVQEGRRSGLSELTHATSTRLRMIGI